VGSCGAVKGEDKKRLFCRKELTRDLCECMVSESLKKKMLRCFSESAHTHWDDNEHDEMFDLSEWKKQT